ncbi:MAG: HAD family hydrolase [Gemmatimonadetes bacterium]|nr:HAD family hydrolase [Gemmatimonadota bacterium]
MSHAEPEAAREAAREAAKTSARAALFIDRDGTLIEDAHYLSDASRVRLIPGAAEAVRTANAAQLPVVIVTNQSGIARGLITEAQYDAVRARTEALLAAAGATVLTTVHCPHWPEVSGPCDCRKPGLGLYRDAASRYGLDLARSGYVGDRWRDVAPAQATGGVGVLVPGVETPESDVRTTRQALGPRIHIARALAEAVSIVLAAHG